MPRAVPLLAAVVACVVLAPRPAAACTPAVRAEVARRAITLMPPSLARQLKKHIKQVEAGATEGIAGSPAPVEALDPGHADEELETRVREIVALLDTRAPMARVARAFGYAARTAADLSFGLHVGPRDPRADRIYGEFCRFVESRLPRMVVTFAGYSDPELANGDIPAFARRVAAQARRDYDGILNTWYPPGRQPVAQDFDDRSVAFGTASIEVSLALTATARAWLYSWNAAGGDLAGTPFL